MFGFIRDGLVHVGRVFEGRHSDSTATRCGTTSVSTASHVLHQFAHHAGPDLGLYQVGEHLEIVSSRPVTAGCQGVDETFIADSVFHFEFGRQFYRVHRLLSIDAEGQDKRLLNRHRGAITHIDRDVGMPCEIFGRMGVMVNAGMFVVYS